MQKADGMEDFIWRIIWIFNDELAFLQAILSRSVPISMKATQLPNSDINILVLCWSFYSNIRDLND